ncbi:hypothetical protein PENSPDRAFT_690372 [Peniophora sp. CONT]|nr:hypothetical protein PENSPDRAFT_690372 [Peniophora sp. CONT]
MSLSSSSDLPSKKFGSIYASLPPSAQRALFEQHLLPLLDKAESSSALDAASSLQTRFLGLPDLRLTERTHLTNRLIHDLERQPAHSTLLDELTDTLSLWSQDLFSVVFEYRTNFSEAHECLMQMAKVVAEAADACMGVAGCHCATNHLPFDVVFEKRRSGKVVKHVQVSGLESFEVRVLRWLWREVCVGVLKEEGDVEGGKMIRAWLDDVEDLSGWRGVVGVLYGGRTRWDDVDDDAEDEDEVEFEDDEEDDLIAEEEDEQEEVVDDDGAEGWEDESTEYTAHKKNCPFHAPHWPPALDVHSPILRDIITDHLTTLFARAPCAELFNAITHLSTSARTTILANLDKTALSSPDNLAPALTVLLREHHPDAPRIWTLLDNGRHLLRPRDAPTLQRLAGILGAISSERSKAQSLILRELIQSARSIHAALLSIFPRLDEPRVRKDLARVLRIAPGEINRAQAIRDWVRGATRGLEGRTGGGAGGAGGGGLGPMGGPGAAQMAAIAQMMGFPVPPEALEGAEEEDEVVAMGLGGRSREDRADLAGLKERFNGWVDVAVALGRSQALLVKAYHDASAFVPYIKDTEVCSGVLNALADRGADTILDALDGLDSFAKAQRKREATMKARKEREAKAEAQKAATAAAGGSGGSGGAGPSTGAGKSKTKTTGSSSTAGPSNAPSSSTSSAQTQPTPQPQPLHFAFHPSAPFTGVHNHNHNHNHNHPSTSHNHNHNHTHNPIVFGAPAMNGWGGAGNGNGGQEESDEEMPPLEPISGPSHSFGAGSAPAPAPAPAPPTTNAGAGHTTANPFAPGGGGFGLGAGPTPPHPQPAHTHAHAHAHALPPHNPLAQALSAMFGLAVNQALNGQGGEDGDSDSDAEGPPALMPAERDSDEDGEGEGMPALERVETGYHGIEDVD